MSKQIELWEIEHRNFAKLLDVLETQLAIFHEGSEPDYDLMLDIMDYMISYTDRVHHPKEDLVFARIAERAPAVRGTIEQLARQHREIAESGKDLHRRLESLLGGAILSRQSIEEPARKYIDSLREHMDTEYRDVFPAVRKTLRADDWNAIDAEAGAFVPDPLFGERLEQQYEAIHRAMADNRQ